MKCRNCASDVNQVVVDLGACPPSNSLLKSLDSIENETSYPLELRVCKQCWLVQIDEVVPANNIFGGEYVYYSSFSTSWIEHAKQFVSEIEKRHILSPNSLIAEIGSNDGYLLRNFDKNRNCLGIEPSNGPAQAARKLGIDTIEEFFNANLAEQILSTRGPADLIIANNVVAHVPDIHNFTAGISKLLSPKGVFTVEVPHLCSLIDKVQFDTIYHEHFSYFSLISIANILSHHGLEVYDVQLLKTHGGSLRLYIKHHSNSQQIQTTEYEKLLEKEYDKKVDSLDYYIDFPHKVAKVKEDFLCFLRQIKAGRKTVVGYGAAAKASMLLNCCGIDSDLIEFVADKSPHKQEKFMPGCHIPIVKPECITDRNPDYIVIFPWNIKQEIARELKEIYNWTGSIVTAIPGLEVSNS